MYDPRLMTAVRPRTSIVAAWIDGWRRVAQAPMLVAGLTLACAFALELTWRPQFLAWAPGAVFGRHLTWIFGNEPFAFGGLTAFLENALAAPRAVRTLYWDQRLPAGVSFFSVATMMLAGGAIDRLARMRRVRVEGFVGTTGVFFFRFLRLGVILGGADWIVTQGMLPWLRDAAFAASPDRGGDLLLAAGGALLFAIAIVGDYAQARAVVEDRRSAISAVAAGLRFIRRRPAAVLGLYAMSLAPMFAAWMLVRAAQFTTSDELFVTAGRWLVVLVSVVTRLGFMGTTVAFFQAELAHAGYTARAIPAWPDSPAVEAIAALDGRAPGDARPNPPLPL